MFVTQSIASLKNQQFRQLFKVMSNDKQDSFDDDQIGSC